MEKVAKSYTIALTQRQAAALCHAVAAHRDEFTKIELRNSAEIVENRRALVEDLDALLHRVEAVSQKIGDGRLIPLTSEDAKLLHFVLACRYEQVDEELGDHGWVHRHLLGLDKAIGSPIIPED